MTNTARNNRKYGFNAENELLQFLRDHGIEAERLHLTGKEDEGDFVAEYNNFLGHRALIIQLKTFAARSAAGKDRPLSPTGVRNWLKALDAQREHYRAHRGLSELPDGMLIVKVKNTSWDDAFVISRLGEWVDDD
jgi:hypothetical protein